MKIDITHGVYRVMQQSGRYWKSETGSHFSEPFDITSLGILLALLDEDECRAAFWLAEYGIDCRYVEESLQIELLTVLPEKDKKNKQNTEKETKFPQRIRFFLDGDELTVGRLEPALLAGIFVAAQNLHNHMPQLVFATEHLLYALSLTEDETGKFLRDQRMTPENLIGKIFQQEGIDTTETEVIRISWNEAVENLLPEAETQMFCDNTALRDDLTAGYRILDASANRAIEAIRVLEDYVRFGLDNAEMVRLTKQMRHELASALRELPRQERLTARCTITDVGADIEGSNEYHRASLTDVLAANFSRLQESLRSLEEYGKIVAPRLARTAERLRYRSYTLQKTVLVPLTAGSVACGAKQRMAKACLYVLLDCRESEVEFVGLVQAVMQGGADVIQLRDKQIGDRQLLHRARRLRELTADRHTLMIINDRPDIALLSRADGVHVGQEELSPSNVRQLVGHGMLIGVSTHSMEQANQAVRDGADYLGAGPVFPSLTKTFDAFPGMDFLRQIAVEISLPTFAIGGINPNNLLHVIESGLRRIAVQSVVTESQDPATTCRKLKEMLVRKEEGKVFC